MGKTPDYLEVERVALASLVHSFLVPWRKAHPGCEQLWPRKRSPDWDQVDCLGCLALGPPDLYARALERLKRGQLY